MIGYRWLRAAMRGAVGFLTVLPAIALLAATLVDRGPDGELRVSLFPIALQAFDPFAWTCARNSLIFATALTTAALIVGVGVGWVLAGLPSRGRTLVRPLVSSMLAAPPACLALGMVGLWGTTGPGPWPHSLRSAASGGLSLDAWSGWPAWLLWIWTSAPSAVALVAIASGVLLERIEPAWRDAARLAGAGPFRAWRTMTWPLIRPAAARAAAIVFPLALLEPGAPLILGLRRTLAYQIVDAAARPDPFPRIAIWTAMAAGFSLVGRWLLRWWGGPMFLDRIEEASPPVRPRIGPFGAGAPLATVGIPLVIGSVAAGWSPVLGLARILIAPDGPVDGMGGAPVHTLLESLVRAAQAPVPQVLANSLMLGIGVGAGTLVLSWLLRPAPGTRFARTLGSRVIGRFALMPPLVQGVGFLALLSLASALIRSMGGLHGQPGDPDPIDRVARDLDGARSPWPILFAAVGLSIGLRLLQNWRRSAERRPAESRSGFEAALLARSGRARARGVAALRPARWAGALVLAASLAAVNLAPALLFTPWMDVRTAAPAILIFAEGPRDAYLQAAFLAVFAIAGHLAGLCVTRLAPAPPPEWDPDPP